MVSFTAVILGYGFTVTVIVAVLAQSPVLGVNVYVVVALRFGAGLQLPFTPLLEVVGKLMAPPVHIAAIGVKVGLVFA
jgi:hypothetical protein